ncbi:unnamed protein product [Parnassius apollo]|uniref:(apollo) hypothetical protein n=1 Tax=Parnassius apollo TaxID=110799 RepID=A0A8S3W400_PARAO|nr:unnamed protein product [Parnassius apollo]
MLWGLTAALAFELPQDPYSPFNHHADPLHRRMDTKTIYFTDYDGKVVHKMPYKRLPQSGEIDEYLEEYDIASKATESCEKLYPECDDHLADVNTPEFSY